VFEKALGEAPLTTTSISYNGPRTMHALLTTLLVLSQRPLPTVAVPDTGHHHHHHPPPAQPDGCVPVVGPGCSESSSPSTETRRPCTAFSTSGTSESIYSVSRPTSVTVLCSFSHRG
jgi:hypothetical protein